LRTPTLKQLSKRPALWVFAGEHPHITMPDGGLWELFYGKWVLHRQRGWHYYVLRHYEFGGWL